MKTLIQSTNDALCILLFIIAGIAGISATNAYGYTYLLLVNLEDKSKGFTAVAMEPNGSILVVQGSRVLRIQGQKTSTIIGTETQGNKLDENDATQTQLSNPNGIAVAPDGAILVADTDNNRVLRVFDNKVSVVIGTGVYGDHFEENDPTKTQLGYPRSIALASDGSILIADTGNRRVLRVQNNKVSIITTADKVFAPIGVALGSDGSVFVLETFTNASDRIVRVKDEEVAIVTNGDFQSAQNTIHLHLHSTSGMAVAPDGSIVIAQYWGYQVSRIHGKELSTVVSANHNEHDVWNEEDLARRSLSTPSAVAVAPDGSVLVVSVSCLGVFVITPNDEIEQTLRGLVNSATGDTWTSTEQKESKEGKEAISTLKSLSTPTINTLKSVNKRRNSQNKVIVEGPLNTEQHEVSYGLQALFRSTESLSHLSDQAIVIISERVCEFLPTSCFYATRAHLALNDARSKLARFERERARRLWDEQYQQALREREIEEVAPRNDARTSCIVS